MRYQAHNLKLKTELIKSADRINVLEADNQSLTYIANTSMQYTDSTLSACEELLRINSNLIKLHSKNELLSDAILSDTLLKSAESSEDTN